MTDPSRKFIDAATDLFAERGLHGVSLADVARELGLTKQSVLYHFKTKQALFGAVLGEVADRLSSTLVAVKRAEVTPTDRVGLLIDGIHTHMAAHPQDARIIARELADNPGRVDTARSLPLTEIVDIAVSILHAHPAAAPLPEARVAAATYQLIGAIVFFSISEPTLRAMWGSARLDSVKHVFLPVLKEAWGV
ncbi:MAG: TetR/AcrR family transcriptional regulator [Pseudomonadota bacterium]